MIAKSFIKHLVLVPFLVPAFAGAKTIDVTAPTIPTNGKLLITGTVSKDIGSYKGVDVTGKVTSTDTNLSGQEDTYSACLFKRNASGIAIKESMDSSQDCVTGTLNQPLALISGSYWIVFQNSVATLDVNSGETTKVDLLKVQVPKVAGATEVKIYTDYKNTYEQNKYFFGLRIDSQNQDYISSLDGSHFGRTYVLPFMESGNYTDIGAHARDTFFTADGELCSTTADGSLDDSNGNACNREEVGTYETQGTRTVCKDKPVRRRAGILGPSYNSAETSCSPSTVNYDWSRAYFLVFPGNYIIQWNTSDTVIVEKSITAR